MTFVDLIVSIWTAMFELFWFGKKSISNTLSIYVKSYTGRTLSVDLDPKWDIKNVKEVIGPKLGLPPEEVKIIFAGKELDDSTVIEECDLGEQSILHAVRAKRPKGSGSGSRPLNEILTELASEEVTDQSEEDEYEPPASETPEGKKAGGFWVFCTKPCEGVKRGKLRVRCAACGSGAITLDSDPASWPDVLQPHRISGHCEAEGCPTGAVSWAEFYFKCGEHTSKGEKDQAVPLSLIRANRQSVPCLACTDILDPVIVFACGHTTCLDCFREYCWSRLRDRAFTSHPTHGYTLPCPAKCQDSYITEPHHFRLLTKQQYNQYQKFGAEEWVLNSGGVLCPRPGCGAGIIPDLTCNKVVCQNGCGYIFCRNCLEGYHIGECSPAGAVGDAESSYAVDPERAAQAKWNEASKVAIKITTKPCPKCRAATERSGGCMHMVCTRCSYEWCWVCQVEWTRNCMGEHWFG